jgi:hypothetical protein
VKVHVIIDYRLILSKAIIQLLTVGKDCEDYDNGYNVADDGRCCFHDVLFLIDAANVLQIITYRLLKIVKMQ